jgi:hypothetical protein
MKFILTNNSQKWGAAILSCLLLVTERSPAQFVEVSLQIEGISWPQSSAAQQTENRRTYTARCVFGTNNWLIEGEFALNAKETWWCIGTNIIKHVLITKDPPKPEAQKPATGFVAGVPSHAGEQFTTIYTPSDARPISGIAEITWLAFCSGPFLKAEGRRILPPFPTGAKENDYTDKVELFDDALSLPKRIDIYRQDKDLVCSYKVQQSTNFAGWSFPVQFEITQYDQSGGGSVKPYFRASATVTSIQKATQPLVPPEVMKRAAQ